MAETIARKCDKCKEEIIIERSNIKGPVLYKGKYYHSSCFCELCEEKKATTKRSLLFWQNVLDDIEQYKDDAVEKSKYQFAKNDLNAWILNHYNVMTLPSRFWNIVADLEKGTYNNKQCKPVKTVLLFETWRWGQKRLDAIARKNRSAKKGPKTDLQRVNYDLAIVLNHIEDYKKYVAKLEAEEAERAAMEKERVRIDYSKVQAKKEDDGLGDINDLLDDLI